MTGKYQIACIQAEIEIIDAVADKDAVIARNIERSLDIAEGAIVRDEVRVVVLPEAFMQGYSHARTPEDWQNICIEIPGAETARIGAFAKQHQVYIAGAAYERDPDWPEIWFTTGFIVGPSGDVELRYRKLHEHNVEGLIPNTSPADVLTEYIERYGEDALFPVLDTPYGRLAVIVENDLNFFELSRVLTFHGAEIFLHPTSEENGPLAVPRDQARRSRCYENRIYLASANAGELVSKRRAAQATRGCSALVDFRGNFDSRIDGAGESVLVSTIQLERLRLRRTEVFMNYPAQVKSEFFANEYAKAIFLPVDTGPATRETLEAAIATAQARGLLVSP
jgi:predicted amidohydrolase